MESKKRSLGADERDEFLRAAWGALVAGEIDAGRLVFVDGMGSNTAPLRSSPGRDGARGPTQRRRATAPRNRGKNTTLLASMSLEGMRTCLAVVGSATKAVFEFYVERVLAPSLSPGQVVVMDNLAAHKGERVRELVEERGCEL
ncbi:MAG: transposase, partial [Actinomycetota bacterium]|nr:transposase [Actinomycetota bacterium]